MPDPLFHDLIYCGQQLRVESAQFGSAQGTAVELVTSDHAPTPAAASRITATAIVFSLTRFLGFELQSQGAPLQHSLADWDLSVVFIPGIPLALRLLH